MPEDVIYINYLPFLFHKNQHLYKGYECFIMTVTNIKFQVEENN